MMQNRSLRTQEHLPIMDTRQIARKNVISQNTGNPLIYKGDLLEVTD
jgi:hypothetical protein